MRLVDPPWLCWGMIPRVNGSASQQLNYGVAVDMVGSSNTTSHNPYSVAAVSVM